MTSTAVAAFAARGIAARESLNGAECSYQNHEFTGTASPERDARTLRDGGFSMEYDRTLRVAKSALSISFKPETPVSVAGKNYRIKDVRDAPLSSEWILGLVQIA
ncbi:MAG: hypothetical protein ACOYNN_04155 [Terrimicrobiaceae bacterium]